MLKNYAFFYSQASLISLIFVFLKQTNTSKCSIVEIYYTFFMLTRLVIFPVLQILNGLYIHYQKIFSQDNKHLQVNVLSNTF